MVEGPKGRIFGFRPYSAMIRLFGVTAKLRTVPVHVRDGAIYLDRLPGAGRHAAGSGV
jgi:hypothetical protein